VDPNLVLFHVIANDVFDALNDVLVAANLKFLTCAGQCPNLVTFQKIRASGAKKNYCFSHPRFKPTWSGHKSFTSRPGFYHGQIGTESRPASISGVL
jgi:hypothetical protein